MLYVVSTPIGNLEDMSYRGIRILKESDLILAEDTRKTGLLLHHYQISTPMLSYHQFEEKKKLEFILQELSLNKLISLVSDAGTPCIQDPGTLLIQACIEKNLPVTAIPGPSSVMNALVLSGGFKERFQFAGFMPRKGTQVLKSLLSYPGTTVAFESPERIVGTLQAIEKLDPQRTLHILREMTKKFEERIRGTPQELLHHFQKNPPRGEIVLVIQEGSLPDHTLNLEETVLLLQSLHGLSLKESIQVAASITHIPKTIVYAKVHSKKKKSLL